MYRAARGIVTILALLLVLPATGQNLDESLRWDRVMRPGGEFEDGMLASDLLIVHFRADANPRIERAKDGRIESSQLALDQVNDSVGVRRFERLFSELPAAQKAAQPAGRELLWLIEFDAARGGLRQVAERYLTLPTVTRVEPVAFHHLSAAVPNDPSFSSQLWLRAASLGQKDIRALAGWYFHQGDPDVIIAIADSGVDWQHPDLGGSSPNYLDGVIWDNVEERTGTPGVDDDGNGKTDDVRGWDFIDTIPGNFPPAEQTPAQDDGVEDNDPMDYESHGTWVAGCAGAWTDNGIGVAGASWGCTIMPLRMGYLPDGETNGIIGTHWAARAMDYARINGASVFNASWGSSETGGLSTATDNAIAADMVIVTAAGNANNQTASYLAARSDVLAVAAVNGADAKASFSSYGTWVDVSAPGMSTLTTEFNRFLAGAARHSYGDPSGTSFSSPIVAGVAGLYRSANPGDSAAQTRAAIKAAVDDIDAQNPAYAGKLGTGRINLGKLLGAASPWRVPEHLPTMLDAFNTSVAGDEVRVRGGITLDEQLTVPQKALTISGAWDASYATRDLVNDLTIIDPTASVPGIRASNAMGNEVVVDGFEVTGGNAVTSSLAPINGRYGGGILISNDANPILRNLLVHGNLAGGPSDHGGGGAVGILNASPIFEDCEFTGNSGSQGSAIYVYKGSPTFRRVNVHDNVSYGTGIGLDPKGGAVYLVNTNGADVVRFEDGNIDDHDVVAAGGAIYSDNSNLELVSMSISGNQADSHGGAIYVENGSLDMQDSDLIGNSILPGSNGNGGGLFGKTAAITISGGSFSTNSAAFGGGALMLEDCSSPSISGLLVYDNSTTLFASGIYLNNCSNSLISQSTVAANRGASAGGNGIYVAGGNADIDHSIFALNGSAGVSLADGVACAAATVNFACNLAWSNNSGDYGGCPDPTGSNGNVIADPLFCDAGAGDFTIPGDSPAAAAQSGCGDMGSEAATCGKTSIGGDGGDDDEIPAIAVVDLRQNHPNPFNPNTRIQFSLALPGHARLAIYDGRGRLVRILVDQELPAGDHEVQWTGVDDAGQRVASGVYLYELLVPNARRVRKMGLLK